MRLPESLGFPGILGKGWHTLKKPAKVLASRNPGPAHSVEVTNVVHANIANFRIIDELIN